MEWKIPKFCKNTIRTFYLMLYMLERSFVCCIFVGRICYKILYSIKLQNNRTVQRLFQKYDSIYIILIRQICLSSTLDISRRIKLILQETLHLKTNSSKVFQKMAKTRDNLHPTYAVRNNSKLFISPIVPSVANLRQSDSLSRERELLIS